MCELRQNDSTIPHLIMDAHAHDGYISDEYSVVVLGKCYVVYCSNMLKAYCCFSYSFVLNYIFPN